MARVVGKAGGYAFDRATKNFIWMMAVIYLLCMFMGVGIGYALALRSPVAFVFLAVVTGLFWLVRRYCNRLEKKREAWEHGLEGEVVVGRSLVRMLPDSYHVVHDLQTKYGNIDHVVVGPTGVFAVETKNWRGWVTSDGNGELLLNGKATDKPYVKRFTGRIMALRDRWTVLAETDRFIQGVMVFASAYEDAKWGTTGNVQCIPERRIPDYFLQAKPQRPLSSREVARLSRAFAALARVADDFKEAPEAKTAESEADS